MTPFDRAALIGFWRQGCTPLQIAGLTGLTEEKVKKIIDDYQRKKESNTPSEATEKGAGSV